MTIQQIYDLSIEMGIKSDPRGEEKVKKYLKSLKKEYEELSEKKKKLFDLESLKNPYSDSRILFGDPKKEIKKVLAGIDAEEAEILLADRLNQKGERVDLLISHHPTGGALWGLNEVTDLQVDVFESWGIPVNVAHALFEERKSFVKRRFNPLNNSRTTDFARILNIPLLAIHTIWDNMSQSFIKNYLDHKEFDTLGEILDYLNEIPEFIESSKLKSGPFIASGSPKSRCGKIVVGFTGGTNPSKELYSEMAKAGIGTLVEMHIPEESLDELKKLHINVIDVGHMAADSIGANLFLDELEKRGVDVIPCSGLIRIKRIENSK